MKVLSTAPNRFRGFRFITYHARVNESGAYVRFSYYLDLKRKRATVVKWLVGFKPGSWGRSYLFHAYLGESSQWIGPLLAGPNAPNLHEWVDSWFNTTKSEVIEYHLIRDIPLIEAELAEQA